MLATRREQAQNCTIENHASHESMVSTNRLLSLLDKGLPDQLACFAVSFLQSQTTVAPVGPDHLDPSFSSDLAPCSSHSCFDIHILCLSAICNPFFVSEFQHVYSRVLTYDVCQHGSAQEYHMPSPWWIFNSHFKFLLCALAGRFHIPGSSN